MRRSRSNDEQPILLQAGKVDSSSMGERKASEEQTKKIKSKSGYFTDDELRLIVKHGLMTSGDLRYRGILNSVYSNLKSEGFKNSTYKIMHCNNVLNEIDNALSDGEPIGNVSDASDDTLSVRMQEHAYSGENKTESISEDQLSLIKSSYDSDEKEEGLGRNIRRHSNKASKEEQPEINDSTISESNFYGNHNFINSILVTYGDGAKVERDFTKCCNKDSVIGNINAVFGQIAYGVSYVNLGLSSIKLLYFMLVAISHKNAQGQRNTFQYVRHHVFDISKSVVNVTSSILSVGKMLQWWGLGLLGPTGVAIVTVSAILINSLISIVELTNEMVKLRCLLSKKNLDLPLRLSIQKRLAYLNHKRNINIGFTVVAIAAVVLASINPVGPIVAGVLVLGAAVAKYYLKSYYYPKKEVLTSTDKEGLLIDRTLVYLHKNIINFQNKIDSLEKKIESLESQGGQIDKVNRYKKRLSLYRLKLARFSCSKGNLKKLNQKKEELKLSLHPSIQGRGAQLLEELNAIEMASKIRTTSSTRTPKSAKAFQSVLWPFKKVFFNELHQSADTKKVFLKNVIASLHLKQDNSIAVHASSNQAETKLDPGLNFNKKLLTECKKLLSRRAANKISTKNNNHPQSIIFDKDLLTIMNKLRSYYASKLGQTNVNTEAIEVKTQGVDNSPITENLLFSYERNFDPKRKFLQKVIKECKIMISALGKAKYHNNQRSQESSVYDEKVTYTDIIDKATRLISLRDRGELWLKGDGDHQWVEFNSQFSELIRTMTEESYTNNNDRSSIANLLLHYDKLFSNDRHSSSGAAVGSVRRGSSSVESGLFSSRSSSGTDEDDLLGPFIARGSKV